jgi:hypothetical protein
MSTTIRFAKGDTVRHPKRPEWGLGTVRDLQAIAQPDGSRAQRLTVDFANQGRKMINTAVAPLERSGTAKPAADSKPKTLRNTPDAPLPTHHRLKPAPAAAGASQNGSASSDSESASGGSGWLDDLDGSSQSNELWDLPDDLTNPFGSLADRLRATLATYRFNTDARPLIDWAVSQTGLNDPLSKYTRPELEQAFPRFARDRDQHLRDLVRQCKRADDFVTLKEVGRGLFPAAQSALDKAIRG